MASIRAIEFGVLSPKAIRDMSVCEVVTSELYDNNRPKRGGLRDPRFGVASRRGMCTACGQTWSACSGHFGHYELPVPVFHIGWQPEVLQWLRRTCTHCGRLHAVKAKKCPHCARPTSRYNRVNATTLKVVTPESVERLVHAQEALEILQRLPPDDVLLFRPGRDGFHPAHLILTVLPIPPNCVRPSPTMDGDEVRGEDDITRRLLYIMRICQAYKRVANENSTVVQHAVAKVQDAVHLYIDQTRMSSKQKNVQTTRQKSISERLRGKQGRLRGTLMGKRCNYTARTVITGDAMLDMRDVGVPRAIAEKLTIVERVHRFNYETIRSQVTSQDKRIKYIIRKDGTRLDQRTIRGQAEIHIGDAVERTLRDGDLVLFNRQPSLHRMSIMCHRAKILEGKTFRLNLTCTTPYNADFDGDEMNLHALQTHASRADALELMSVAKNIITPQSNKPVMGIVQDSLLSAFMMTADDVFLERADMCDIVMWVEGAELPPPAIVKPQRWTGRQCMSLLFPKDFQWGSPDATWIYNGELLRGRLGKKALGRSHGSIIHVLYNDYGPDRTCRFINELQRINHIWFSGQGFSIGIGDMRVTQTTAQRVQDACANIDHDVEDLIAKHGSQSETRINRMLNQTRDSMGLIAQNAMPKDNCLGMMVKSGSKGSLVNILQIMACVGQQNCSGKRMQATLRGRTLPMFTIDDVSARSRGFVKHSYIDGLTPDEYWHHTVGGREGLIDTAVKTSTTGYIQRRLVKSLESVHVANDGSVRDSQNRLMQFQYGEDGLDGMCHEMVLCPFDTLTREALADVYSINAPDWSLIQQAYTDWSWFAPFKHGSSEKWASTVPAQRILDKHADGGQCSMNEAVQIVAPLLQTLQANTMVHAYVVATMASAIVSAKCSASNLTRIVDLLMRKWQVSTVAPGEMVGTIAAQSVGEPTTQMTLNTFHSAGNSAKNVTLGVPRFEELINASHKIKTPVCTVFADAGLAHRPETAWKLASELRRTKFSDLVDAFEYGAFSHDPRLENYRACPDNQRWDSKKKSNIVLRCKLSRKRMVQRGLDIYDIVNVLRTKSQSKHMCFAYTDNPAGDAWFYAKCRKQHATKQSFFQYTKQIFDTTLKGSPHIPSTTVRTEGKITVVDTCGIDLLHTHTVTGIQYEKTQCNDIFAIRATYGIEAARAMLLKEMHSVLSFDGSYVNMRHLMLIVDWMTWMGSITALTRHGVKKMMETSTPLKRATFEQPVEIFHHAAVKGLVDELKGVSEQILLGTMPKCGSHFNGVITEKAYQAQWDSDDWQPPPRDTAQPMDICVDTWRPTPDMWQGHTTYATTNPVAERPPPAPQVHAWQQPQVPAWQQPQVPAWQQPQAPAWQQPQAPAPQTHSPASPAYSPGSPAYSPGSPAYSPSSPVQKAAYSPSSPAFKSPVQKAAYSPSSPAYSPASPAYSPGAYSPSSPVYSPSVKKRKLDINRPRC